MNAIRDLFESVPMLPNVQTPAARHTDPITSKIAAEQVTASGLRGHQQRQVLAALREWPGRTSDELAQLARMDRYAVARRLPELVPQWAYRGDVRESTVSGRPGVTWWPVQRDADALSAAA